jgi:hypothetical protein
LENCDYNWGVYLRCAILYVFDTFGLTLDPRTG